MSITYEEALSTLTSMFGSPWSEEDLDAVLRHHQGHMENTVEDVLGHGDGAPKDLLEKLKNTKTGPDQLEQDAQLAQQLAMDQEGRSGTRNQVGSTNSNSRLSTSNSGTMDQSGSSSSPTVKGKGTHTVLPDDFLRIPGMKGSQSSVTDDAALARMLQDKLFAEEVRNNPEFAHLAGAGGGGGRGRPNRAFPGNQRGGNGQQQGPRVMEALSGMGENAKKRFREIAVKFKAMNNQTSRGGNASGGLGGSSGVSERRGLLDLHDDEEQEVSFLQKQDSDYEMKSMPPGNKKSD